MRSKTFPGKPSAHFTKNPVLSKGQKKAIEAINHLPVAWNFGEILRNPSFDRDDLFDLISNIISYEGKTIVQLLNESKHNHSWKVQDINLLNKEFKKILEQLNVPEDQEVFQLAPKNVIRVFGKIEHNIFHVLHYDKTHSVYPTQKCNT